MAAVASSPVGELDSVDVVGVRKDGGLDMVVSVVTPIDDSPSTLLQLETKVRNYMDAAKTQAFLRRYRLALGQPVTICISCAKEGISLELRKHMGDLP